MSDSRRIPACADPVRREWTGVILISAAVLLLSSLPVLTGYLSQTGDLVFSGAVLDRQDFAVHTAAMRWGKSGSWQYQFRFTTESHQGAYVKMAYIFLGHLAGWLNADIVFVYQASRIVLGLIGLLGIYKLGQAFLETVFMRRIFLLLAAAGSGLGWLQWLLGWVPLERISPIDFWMIDPYYFFSLMLFPHFLMIDICILLIMLVYWKQLNAFSAWNSAAVVGLLLVMQLIQPYSPLLAAFVMVGMLVGSGLNAGRVDWWRLIELGVIYLFQIPLLVYNWFVFYRRPFWGGFASQNITPSPPFIYILWGFGLLWAFAAVGIWTTLRWARGKDGSANWNRKDFPGTILAGAVTWLVFGLLAAYLPWNIQRRLMHWYILPVAILAAAGLEYGLIPGLKGRVSGSLEKWIKPGVLLAGAVMCFSTLYLSLGTSLYISSRPERYFDSIQLAEAADWLRENGSPDDSVLTSESAGLLIGARSGLRVYLGHPMETMDYRVKTEKVEQYLQGSLSLDDLPGCCTWLVAGPEDRFFSREFPSDEWEPVKQFGDTLVFRNVQERRQD